MNEGEVLDRVDEIGQAFANDLNDGDGPDFEGLYTYYDEYGDLHLVYTGTVVDEDEGEKHTTKVVWRMELVSLDES